MKHSIYKCRDVLSPTYIPQKLPHREDQSITIKNYLNFALEESTPPHMIIIGPNGSGKTATILKLIRDLKGNVGNRLNIGYTLSANTSYQTLVGLGMDMNIFLPFSGRSFIEIWRSFESNI